jgi:GNAT superfamily N-acetyltransferase
MRFAGVVKKASLRTALALRTRSLATIVAVPTIPIRRAELPDVDAIVGLVNQAFVAESPYIEGERVSSVAVSEMLSKGKFLLLERAGRLAACIYIEGRGTSAHIGLVSVDPGQQGAGLGSQLMAAAEADCRAAGCREMELRFINHRADLHRFYQRLGFHDTGVQEFPHPARMKVPFHFVQMAKSLF